MTEVVGVIRFEGAEEMKPKKVATCSLEYSPDGQKVVVFNASEAEICESVEGEGPEIGKSDREAPHEDLEPFDDREVEGKAKRRSSGLVCFGHAVVRADQNYVQRRGPAQDYGIQASRDTLETPENGS